MKLLNPLNHYQKSLGTKIFYLFTSLILIICLSFMVFFVYFQSKTLKQNLIYEGGQLAGLLAYNSRLGVFAENEDLLEDAVEGIMQNKEVIQVQIFTGEGRELKIRAKSGEKNKKGFLKQETVDALRQSGSPFYSEDNNKIEFWAPVISSGGYNEEEYLLFGEGPSGKRDSVIGFVRIIFTTELMDKSFRDLLLKSILILVFLMIPSWSVIYFIVKGITKPLKSLTEDVKEIETRGSIEKVSPVNTKDETGRLALAFNNMVGSLKKKDAEKQHLEQQLRHSQKMEAVGTLSGGIAHDFNNILTGVIGFGQLLQIAMDKDDPLRHHVKQILTSAKKGADLTQSLLAFSRKQILTPEPINVNEVIEGIKKLLSRIISEDIELQTILAEKPLTIMADRGQIEQVLLNLATNAKDAMPGGGQLTIISKPVDLNRQFPADPESEESEQFALISITDTGVGMDKQTKEKIFDPFFTTKEIGKGTGLGLSMVYGIIKQHNGYIDVISEPDKGTTFRIYLPLSESSARKKEPGPPPVLQGGTETILMAEDDETVRKLMTSILRQYGYRVIEAGDGKDAVRKFAENRDIIELLLLDLVMPRMNGKDAYREIQKMRPEIRALFISGYTADIIRNKKFPKEDLDIIRKPVTVDRLLTKVRESLDKLKK